MADSTESRKGVYLGVALATGTATVVCVAVLFFALGHTQSADSVGFMGEQAPLFVATAVFAMLFGVALACRLQTDSVSTATARPGAADGLPGSQVCPAFFVKGDDGVTCKNARGLSHAGARLHDVDSRALSSAADSGYPYDAR